ncbi:MAG: hypothetical protein ACI8XC_001432, partial [Gammaproteobacteria bacterium]
FYTWIFNVQLELGVLPNHLKCYPILLVVP